ncbi:hypothetical protein ED21_23343 [Erythrobacter sp. SD-21]|nr:hypothetical protein ED21_23343 [Erythrobacter sp. SD-21]
MISEDEAGPLEHHIVEWGDGEEEREEDAA